MLIGLIFLTGCQEQPRQAQEQPQPAQQVPTPIPTPPLDRDLSRHFKLIQNGQTGSARVRIRQWLDRHEDDSRGLFLMGLSHHQDKRYARALDWLQQATQAQPTYPPAWHFLGWTYFYLGQTAQSRRSFEHHLQLAPAEGDSHFALGLLDLELWRLDEAEVHFNQAIKLQESQPGRAKGVSKAMARLSEIIEIRDRNQERATQLLRRSVELYPDHYEAWYRLWKLLETTADESEVEQARLGYFNARDRVRPRTEFPE
ncbi:MAG: tetratricopeptide repeat protein [Phycisphaerales bacterium]|nr:tetratricopeptide repeat protein [Phycisphaerales bacterium]